MGEHQQLLSQGMPCNVSMETLVFNSKVFFPTCQVRVVRFYHSCSPPPPRLAIPPPAPPPASPPPPLPPLPRPLFPCQLFAKLFANVRAQCAPLDLNLGPSQLSGHRWTSTCPAQCAMVDLNLGPSQLSVHCWTSTWDLPSSVCTAGPQRPGGQIECQKICQIECQIECQKIGQIKCHEICQIECQKICQIKC